MTKRPASMSLMELVALYQARLPEALDGVELRADAWASGRQGLVGIAVVMMTLGEPDRTRRTFREAADMFVRLADTMESRH